MSRILIIIFLFLLCTGAGYSQNSGSAKVISLPHDVSMEFVFIPPGSFYMGSDTSEKDRHGDEGPVRHVSITKGFYLGKFEVTQAQWMAVMKNNPSIFQNTDDWYNYPVDNVSWNDCREYISRLNSLGLGVFRFPTEAEWEYACRAGTISRYYWGDDPDDWQVYEYAWAFSRAEGKSHPAGEKKPNPWGLYDMSGNMWEWCSDWREPYLPVDTINPTGQASGTSKIYRGGSWFNKPATLRSANRNGHEPDTKGTNSGFRIVLEVEVTGDVSWNVRE